MAYLLDKARCGLTTRFRLRDCRLKCICGLLLICMLAVVLSGCGGGSSQDSVYTVVARIPVGHQPGPVAVNSTTNRAYVGNVAELGSVSIIDCVSDTVLTTLPISAWPDCIAVNPNTNKIYVGANRNLGELHSRIFVIDGNTNQITDTIDPPFYGVSSSTTSIGVNPSTNRVYVSTTGSAGNDNSYVIDGNTDTIIGAFDVGEYAYGMAVNPTNNKIYVTNYESNSVRVIDGSSCALIATVPVGQGPNSVVVNPDTGFAYVFNQTSFTLSVIDGSSNSVIATVPIASASNSHCLALDQTRNMLYLGDSGHLRLFVIDGSSNSVTARVPINYCAAQGVAVNSTLNKVYMTGDSIDGITGAVDVVQCP